VVLVDHAAEHPPALDRRVQRDDDLLVMIGRPLIPGLVRPMPVVMAHVGPQDRPQMALAVDQHPVGALGPYGPYPAFGITIRPGRPRRGLHDPYTLAGEDVIERAGELGAAVPDEEPERADPADETSDAVTTMK
jgi:hypothetical protein